VIVKSQVPAALVGKGPASASIVAWNMYQKQRAVRTGCSVIPWMEPMPAQWFTQWLRWKGKWPEYLWILEIFSGTLVSEGDDR